MNRIEIGKRRSHFLSEVFATVVFCLGAVQTSCPGNSAWVPTENGVVFTYFALTYAILKRERSREYKAVDWPRTEQKRTVCTQGLGTTVMSDRVQGLDLVLLLVLCPNYGCMPSWACLH